MVDKKLSGFGYVQPSDVSDLVVLYLDKNNSLKNGRMSFSSFVSLFALLSGNNTFEGDNTFSGDVIFEGQATFNRGINGVASRATADANGNNISNTYATKTELQQKASFNLFHHDWFDYQLNDMAWLRADTFSWQDGTVYSNAYNHLVADVQGKEYISETIAGHTIWYRLADDGHKIVTQASDYDGSANVNYIYEATGVAWYYILDTTNRRFKLPRIDSNKELLGLTAPVSVFGNGNGLMLTNGQVEAYMTEGDVYNATGLKIEDNARTSVALNGSSAANSKYGNAFGSGSQVIGVTTDQTKSGLTGVANLSSYSGVYKGHRYLYFYVGQFSQTATEQTAGLNSELFNGKLDITSAQAQAPYIKTTYVNGTSGYRIWSDGYCEQWGRATLTSSSALTVDMLKSFKDTNYNVTMNILGPTGFNENNGNAKEIIVANPTVNSFKINGYNETNRIIRMWKACGYLAEGEY